MTTASFLTFATLLVLLTLSWSQPGEAEPTSDHGNPERAAGFSYTWRRRTCARLNEHCDDVYMPCCNTRQHECKITHLNMGTYYGLKSATKFSKQCVWKTINGKPPSTIFNGKYTANNGRYKPGQRKFYRNGAGSIRGNGNYGE